MLASQSQSKIEQFDPQNIQNVPWPTLARLCCFFWLNHIFFGSTSVVCVCVCRLVDISHVMSEPVKDSESQSRASHQVLGGRHSFKTGHICSTYLTKHLQIRKLNLTLPLQQTQAKLHGFLNFLLYSCGVRISISAKVVWSFAKLGHRDMPLSRPSKITTDCHRKRWRWQKIIFCVWMWRRIVLLGFANVTVARKTKEFTSSSCTAGLVRCLHQSHLRVQSLCCNMEI